MARLQGQSSPACRQNGASQDRYNLQNSWPYRVPASRPLPHDRVVNPSDRAWHWGSARVPACRQSACHKTQSLRGSPLRHALAEAAAMTAKTGSYQNRHQLSGQDQSQTDGNDRTQSRHLHY